MMKRWWGFWLLFGLLLGGGQGAVAGVEKEILVGASVALSGKYARTGQEQLNGYTLWLEEINAAGGLLGRPLRLIHYDDESKPETGAKLYEKLISDDKVQLLLGPYSSGVTKSASAVSEKHAFPMVSTGAASAEIWRRGFKYIFGLYTPADTYMDIILDFAKANKLERVAVFNEDTDFPREVVRGIKEKCQALGMKVVFTEEFGKNATDFAAMILKIKAAKPEVILGGTYLPDAVGFVRQARELQLSAKIIGFSVGPDLPDFGQSLGPDADGIMGNTQWEHTLPIPGGREFAQRYQKRYSHLPGYHAAGGYGAGQVLAAAVQQAGSLDREKVREALTKLSITTVFGPYRVDQTGLQVGKPGYAMQWIHGKPEVILPEEFATNAPIYPLKPWDVR